MKTRKLLLIATVTFFIVSCFISQTTIFAQNDESETHIYLPDADEEMVVDDPMDIQEDTGFDYEADEEQIEDEYNYDENDMTIDEPDDDEYDYDEDAEAPLPLEE